MFITKLNFYLNFVMFLSINLVFFFFILIIFYPFTPISIMCLKSKNCIYTCCYYYYNGLLVITAVKILVIGTCMITLAGAAIGTGVLFAGYTLSAAKNPEEADNLFNTTLMAFALIETFVFISFVVAIVAFFL